MYYGTVKDCDIANGIGVRVSLFVSGCTNHCIHCFQPETWAFNYGKPYTQETEDMIINMLKPSYINGFSLLGGEPFEPRNQMELVSLLDRIKTTYPNKDVWCFTGFTYEELMAEHSYPRSKCTDTMLSLIDVLVDGRFVEELKDISLNFRGSSNQRIIDMNKTRISGTIQLLSGIR